MAPLFLAEIWGEAGTVRRGEGEGATSRPNCGGEKKFRVRIPWQGREGPILRFFAFEKERSSCFLIRPMVTIWRQASASGTL
jgi:hypothetical protein